MNFRHFLNANLIEDWHRKFSRLWSIRIAIFWGGVSGLFVVWPELGNLVPLPWFAALSVIMSAALTVARITKQPGANE